MKNIMVVGFAIIASLCIEALFASDDSTERPLLAIWRDSGGNGPGGEVPYLRVAIWNDGRFVVAKDTTRWSNELLEGRIGPGRLAELKKALEGTQVFKLKGNCYLVPDASVDCVMVDLGDKQQMLYWDEIEQSGYGINISPTPHRLEFIACWKEVNRLALAAIPTESRPYAERFQSPPESWRLKRPIQSE